MFILNADKNDIKLSDYYIKKIRFSISSVLVSKVKKFRTQNTGVLRTVIFNNGIWHTNSLLVTV